MPNFLDDRLSPEEYDRKERLRTRFKPRASPHEFFLFLLTAGEEKLDREEAAKHGKHAKKTG